MFKNVLSDQRSPPITDDYRRLQRSPAFTQSSSGAIPATMDDYQLLLSHHRTLTGASWCDGAFNPRNTSVISVLHEDSTSTPAAYENLYRSLFHHGLQH